MTLERSCRPEETETEGGREQAAEEEKLVAEEEAEAEMDNGQWAHRPRW